METEISQLGEFGLIHKLTDGIKLTNESSRRGVGDDCAVMRYHDTDLLVSTDLLLENVHFDLTYVPLKHLGYKAAVVNFSDVYAMNGTPRQITVSLGISKRFTVEHIQELYAGIKLACEVYGVDLVGGDTRHRAKASSSASPSSAMPPATASSTATVPRTPTLYA